MPNDQHIIAEIRRAMAACDVTVTELAKRAGYHREHVSRTLNGGNATADTLQRLADAMQLQWLLEHPPRLGAKRKRSRRV
jgi:DNA-binding phage protein